jgi:hypothetical protein
MKPKPQHITIALIQGNSHRAFSWTSGARTQPQTKASVPETDGGRPIAAWAAQDLPDGECRWVIPLRAPAYLLKLFRFPTSLSLRKAEKSAALQLQATLPVAGDIAPQIQTAAMPPKGKHRSILAFAVHRESLDQRAELGVNDDQALFWVPEVLLFWHAIESSIPNQGRARVLWLQEERPCHFLEFDNGMLSEHRTIARSALLQGDFFKSAAEVRPFSGSKDFFLSPQAGISPELESRLEQWTRLGPADPLEYGAWLAEQLIRFTRGTQTRVPFISFSRENEAEADGKTSGWNEIPRRTAAWAATAAWLLAMSGLLIGWTAKTRSTAIQNRLADSIPGLTNLRALAPDAIPVQLGNLVAEKAAAHGAIFRATAPSVLEMLQISYSTLSSMRGLKWRRFSLDPTSLDIWIEGNRTEIERWIGLLNESFGAGRARLAMDLTSEGSRVSILITPHAGNSNPSSAP